MKIGTLITTHMNADLDALAAMIAARKLYPGARILFPGTHDKSARDFFAKVAGDVMGVDAAKSLKAGDVGTIVIVDTRNPKRIALPEEVLSGGETQIHIFDHHPAQPDDIDGDSVVARAAGSTTTIICGLLIEGNIPPDPVEATLMMAGIYEDTGCLTYPSTTTDDFTAARWLLTCGASLADLRELLFRDMSRDQIRLLNEMLNDLRIYSIHGHDVGIAVANAEEYVGDFAILVQKVKDLENLPVLFGIGRLGDKIFVVGRSRNPVVNVAEILKPLEGGGHSYAASAAVKDLTVFQTEEIILSELRERIEKPKSARDIMSMPVKHVGPEDSVDAAKEVLTRYNINMVPVCEGQDGSMRIVGLISRQNVEKAAFHGFSEYPVKNFMTTEFFSIRPDSSIKEIQDLVFRGRQRLLPVVNERDEPVGVVTRTDFLRIIQDERVKEERTDDSRDEFSKNLNSIMREHIDEATFLRLVKIGEVASSLGFNAYLLGGIVRDLIMRRQNNDVDIVVEGDGIRLVHAIAKMLEVKITEHKKFGTAQLIFGDGRKIDIATARIEYYQSPASLPTVEKGSLKLDLYRRDFTINTLAVKLNPENFGDLIDFFGGVRDIKDGIIRVLHNLSFVEDPTRAFRAARFEGRFGFKISKHALYLIRNAVKMNLFDLLPGTRLYAELELILKEDQFVAILDRLNDLNLLAPLRKDVRWSTVRQLVLRAKDVITWYELLYTGVEIKVELVYFLCLLDGYSLDEATIAVERFGLTGAARKKMLEAKEKERSVADAIRKVTDESDIYFILGGISHEAVLYYMARSDDKAWRKAFSLFFTEQWKEKTIITGTDLITMGYDPSARFGEIMNAVLRERLRGSIVSKDDEIRFIRSRFRPEKPDVL